MSTGATYPDPHDSVGKALTGSLITHGLVISLIVSSGIWHFTDKWGSEHASTGSVGVNMVKTIPIPHRDAPPNPLANPSKSIVPQAPPTPVKQQKQVVAPPKDAIPIPNKFEKPKNLSPREEAKTLFRPPTPYKENQVFSRTPQALSSDMYGTKGSSGIDIGTQSVLGSHFGAYVDLMRDRIQQHWLTAGVNATASQRCGIVFTIARNGMVTNVQVSQASGNYLLDTSAKRALLDANPLPPLPREFTQNEATVELFFQLK